MPHIKSYTRKSPDYTQIAWFVLTTANLSRGAWGSTAKTGLSHYIMNYEAGIVFLPQFIVSSSRKDAIFKPQSYIFTQINFSKYL